MIPECKTTLTACITFQVKQAFKEPGKQMPQIWETLVADVNIFPGRQ